MLWDPWRLWQSAAAPYPVHAVTLHPSLVGRPLSGIPYQHILLGDRVPKRPQHLHFADPIGIAPRQVAIPGSILGVVLEGRIGSLPNAPKMAGKRHRIPAPVVRSAGFRLLVQIRQVALVAVVIVHAVCLSDRRGQHSYLPSVALG